MGGEKLLQRTMSRLERGSPPHGRGKVSLFTHVHVCKGITPAWAGKSFCLCRCDHGMVGSPPHGRGKALVRLRPFPASGITPAWAGKSQLKPQNQTKIEDHPRMGGEKVYWSCKEIAPLGSPPHGRGKAGRKSTRAKLGRITPAWAGKSWYSRCLSVAERDHPRMGGEKSCVNCQGRRRRGSPPHGRGKDKHLIHKRRNKRITPAWAGKSTLSLPHAHTCEDHPRMGGEKQCFDL